MLSKWVRAHGKRFYNFEGLEAFKSKFRPDGWEPIARTKQQISMRLLEILCGLEARRLREINDRLVTWYILAGGAISWPVERPAPVGW